MPQLVWQSINLAVYIFHYNYKINKPEVRKCFLVCLE